MKKILLILSLLISIYAQAQTPVSVFNYPGLNGSPGSCSNENENLIEIIGALSDYSVDGSIVSFANSATLATQLDACTFFFMTDMESQNPSDNSFFPVASAAVIKEWVNGGGVMVMTGTASSYDNDFLNKIFSWDLTQVSGSSWAKNTTNTSGTPFDAVAVASLPNLSATDAIKKNSVANFTTMWGTDDNATVAVIQYGSGYVIFMGFDFYNTGTGCPANSSDWVQKIIPAALEYATNLSSSSVDSITYTSAQYTYSFSQSGTSYYILVAGGSTAPSAAQVKAGTTYSGVSIVANGSRSTTANVDAIYNFTGLVYNTNYDIYMVTEYDDDGTDTFSSVDHANFSTLDNDIPIGSAIANQSVCFNTTVSGLALSITDEYPGNNTFIVTGTSSNTSIVENSGIAITGSGSTRSISITPKTDATGTCTITIKIVDSEGKENTTSFSVTVRSNFVIGSISSDQTICYNSKPALLNGIAPIGGNTPYTYQWQISTDNSTFTNIAGATSLNYQPDTLRSKTYYRALQSSASGCGSGETNTVTITTRGELIAGSISSNQTLCYNSTPTKLTGLAPTGGLAPYSYQWQSSDDGITFTNIAGATTLEFQPGSLIASTHYRLVQSSASGCGIATSNAVTITILNEFRAGSISGSPVLYYRTPPEKFIGVAPTGGIIPYTYQWQKSYDNVNFANIYGATSLDYQAGGESQTTYFRLLQNSASGCGNGITNTITMVVFPEFKAGSIGEDQEIVYNTVPAKIIGEKPRGGRYPYTYQWQNSADGTTFTDIIGATNLDYQPGVLTSTTYYRLIQSSAYDYADEATNTVKVTVYPVFMVGSIKGDQSICSNTSPSELMGIEPTGGDMSYTYQWQSSMDNITFTDITGATSLNYQPGVLTATTQYQCIQTSAFGNGEGITNKITVTVYPEFFVGSISTDQSICYNTAPNELIGIAPTGGNGLYTYQWQSSTDNVIFTDIPGATSMNYQPGALTGSTYYQLVQSTTIGCDELITNKVIITVYPEFFVGSISTDQTICYNTVPNELVGVAPTGGNGSYTYQWQSSTDNSTFTDIPGATSLNYQPGALMATTNYQLIQAPTSGCGGLTTNTVTITVYPEFMVGSITGNQSICNNSIPNELFGTSPTGGNGSYTYQWQSSTDNSTFTDISGATDLNYQPEALTATTYYQLVQSSTAPCSDVLITNKVTIIVYAEFAVGSISANQTICYNTAPAELIGTSPTGGNENYTYQWQRSTDNVSFTDISGATDLNYQPEALAATAYYQLIQASGCGVFTTNKITITVRPMLVKPVIVEKKIAGRVSILMVDNTQNLYYDYLWTYSDGSALPIDLVADKQFLTLPVQYMNASYMVTVFDENACGGTSMIKTVTSAQMFSSVYPTVSNGNIKLDLTGPETGRIQVRIFNEMGNLFKTLQIEKISNTESIPILINDLEDGTYMIEVTINSFREVHRVFIR